MPILTRIGEWLVTLVFVALLVGFGVFETWPGSPGPRRPSLNCCKRGTEADFRPSAESSAYGMLRTVVIAGLVCSLACLGKSAANPQASDPPTPAPTPQPPPPNLPAQTIEDVPWCGTSMAAPGRDLGCGSWSLEHPAPQANDLHAVWAIAANDAWAVGDKGAIVHWDGASWTLAESPTSASLRAVWGTDASHVWAGGDGVFLMFDGTAWKVIPGPVTASIEFITGAATDDIWVSARAAQEIFHWDGAKWTKPGTAPGAPDKSGMYFMVPIWAAGNGRAWAGGCPDSKNAALYFWDGTRWSQTNPGVPGYVGGIAGTAANDIWATSVAGSFSDGYTYHPLHWDGTGWKEESTGLSAAGSFFSPGRNEVWVSLTDRWAGGTVYARREGGAFHPFFSFPDFPSVGWVSAIAAASPTDVFIVGAGGVLANSDGKTSRRWTGPGDWVAPLWADDAGNGWFTSGDVLLRHGSGCWRVVDPSQAAVDPKSGVRMGFHDAAGTGPDDMWFASNFYAVHWDGRSFSQPYPLPWGWLGAIWVSPAGQAYFSATSGLYRAKAGALELIDAPDPSLHDYSGSMAGVWGTSDSDIWWLKGEPGGGSALVHYDGVSRVVAAHLPWPMGWIGTVRGIGGDDVWATVQLQLLHFDGTSSTDLTPSSNIGSVVLRAHNDVWATTPHQIWHFDGSSWSREDSGDVDYLLLAAGGALYSGGVGHICRRP